MKNAYKIVSEQKVETEKELNYIESIVYELEDSTCLEDVQYIFEEISENVVFKEKLKRKEKKNKNQKKKKQQKEEEDKMTINIEYETDKELKLDYEDIINRVINEAVDYAKCPYEAEVNVTLTDNDEIKKINAEYRNINNPTDVLSFPMLNFALPGDFDGISDELENDVEDYFNPDSGELMLGDIVVSVEKVVEQAEKYGHSQERELAFLVAHSMMHLFGYDHMEPDEAAVMESKQKEILDNLGITR